MEKTYIVIAFIFDSGRLGDSFYGRVVFEHMLKDKEIASNTKKTVISTGDLSIYRTYIDIEPYLIKDEICTVETEKLDKTHPFADYPYCWIVEDIDISVAQTIDKRLKDTLPGYIGITKIDPSSENEYKQFWKKLPRTFAISGNKIIVFQNPVLTSPFIFEELSKKLGYEVEYAPDAEYMPIENSSVKQTSFVTCEADRHIKTNTRSRSGAERDAMVMNFDLNKELHISGDFIWKSIVDIDHVIFNSDPTDIRCIEHSFFTLYHAAQGIERLQKILIELIAKKHHITQSEVEEANRVLFTHDHHTLNSWIESKENIKFNSCSKRLFCILQDFYNNYRYKRYADLADEEQINEFALLKEIDEGFKEDYDLIMKKHFGKIMGTISFEYYKLIDDVCHEIQVFTYEIYAYSNAAIVFYNRNAPNLYVELLNKQNEKKELIYWLLKNGEQYPRLKYLTTKALEFDPGMMDEYISDMIYCHDNGESLHGEVDALYDEMCSADKENWKKHREEVNVIANSNVIE